MATYIALVNYTDQGIRNVKDSPKRLDAAKKMLKDMGGELKQFYMTMGSHDIVTVVEAPSDETVAKFVLMLASGGNVRTTTLKAFTEAEYRKLISTLP
jgi:uncharacterized protein with GYD domain